MLINALVTILHGIMVGVFSFVFFFIFGRMCLPKNYNHCLTFRAFPAFVGLTVFSIICWYAVLYQIPLYRVCELMLVLCILLLFVRKIPGILKIFHKGESCTRLWAGRHKTCPYNRSFIRNGYVQYINWITAYCIFYILAFIFLPQPNADHYLPITHISNNDIFNYINTTQHLLFLGPSNLAVNHSQLSSIHPAFAYYQTPAVYYINAWFAMFYHYDAMSIAMPVLYSTVSVIGLLIVYYCHHFFRCSHWVSVGIAAIILCGSFYRFVIGYYFLSSLMGTAVWIASIIEILQNRKTLFLLPYLCLLLLIYPLFFWLQQLIFIGIMGMLLLSSVSPFSFRIFLKKYASFVGCLLLVDVVIALFLPQCIKFSLTNILTFASNNKVLWELPLLSPLAILGLPSYLGLTSQNQLSIMIVFFLFISFLFYVYYKKNHSREKISTAFVASCILFIITLGTFISYLAYFYLAGATNYQPWKFASYFLLPLAGVFWSLFFNVLTYLSNYRKIFILLLIFCILGNFLLYRFTPSYPLKKAYYNLTTLNEIPEKDLAVKMANYSSTFLALFFVPKKQLHLLSYSFYPRESLATVSKNEPFFLESSKGCEFANAKQQTVNLSPLGCLYYGLPVLHFEKNYNFKDNLPFIETHGLFEFFNDSPFNRRWAGSSASLIFYTNKAELKKHPSGYFNIQVNPFLYSGLQAQRLCSNFCTEITSHQWISIPYTLKNWHKPQNPAEDSLRILTLQFQFPDAIAPHQRNFYNLDIHLRSIEFVAVTVSTLPSGKMVRVNQ